MYIVRSPYRLSLFGGSTDIPSFYSKYGSFLIGLTIDRYVYVACRRTPSILDYKTLVHYSKYGSFLIGLTIDRYVYVACRRTPSILDYKTLVHYSKTEKVNNNKEIQHNGVRGVLDYFEVDEGVEITCLCDIPARTGIGSSSSFVVALSHCVAELTGQELTKKTAAKTAIYIERSLLKEPGGIQDQIWTSYGGAGSIRVEPSGQWIYQPLPVSEEFLVELNHRMVLIYTGEQRNSFEIASSHDSSKVEDEKRQIWETAYEAYRWFEAENIDKIGELLHLSWLAKTKTSPLVAPPKIMEIYEKGLQLGAVGGKLLGSGGAGFFLFILQNGLRDSFLRDIQLPHIDFKFETQGAQFLLK